MFANLRKQNEKAGRAISVARAVAHSFNRAARPVGTPRPWPKWALEIKAQRTEGETGVGDTVQRLLGQSGETFKQLYKRMTGKDCGCETRQKGLNLEFPYAIDSAPFA